MTEIITEPIIQCGFAGFAAVLLAIIVWLVRRFIAVLEINSTVIAANTNAIMKLTALTGNLMMLTRSLHDKIISRPCIAKHEG